MVPQWGNNQTVNLPNLLPEHEYLKLLMFYFIFLHIMMKMFFKLTVLSFNLDIKLIRIILLKNTAR